MFKISLEQKNTVQKVNDQHWLSKKNHLYHQTFCTRNFNDSHDSQGERETQF